jgi:hypothetical protein
MTLYSALGEVERNGKEIVVGRLELTADETVSTPFAQIDAVMVMKETDTAPGVTTTTYTFDVDGSDVNIYAWKPTSTSNPSLVAATDASDVSYIIIGRRAR